MNDKELRLKVLAILYQAAKEMRPVPGTMRDKRIEGISFEEYSWASYYLIEHNLVHGEISTTKAGSHGWAGRIKGHGMDIIEILIDKSVEKAEESKISFIAKSTPYLEKLLELMIIWSKNPDLYNQAGELLTRLIG